MKSIQKIEKKTSPLNPSSGIINQIRHLEATTSIKKRKKEKNIKRSSNKKQKRSSRTNQKTTNTKNHRKAYQKIRITRKVKLREKHKIMKKYENKLNDLLNCACEILRNYSKLKRNLPTELDNDLPITHLMNRSTEIHANLKRISIALLSILRVNKQEFTKLKKKNIFYVREDKRRAYLININDPTFAMLIRGHHPEAKKKSDTSLLYYSEIKQGRVGNEDKTNSLTIQDIREILRHRQYAKLPNLDEFIVWVELAEEDRVIVNSPMHRRKMKGYRVSSEGKKSGFGLAVQRMNRKRKRTLVKSLEGMERSNERSQFRIRSKLRNNNRVLGYIGKVGRELSQSITAGVQKSIKMKSRKKYKLDSYSMNYHTTGSLSKKGSISPGGHKLRAAINSAKFMFRAKLLQKLASGEFPKKSNGPESNLRGSSKLREGRRRGRQGSRKHSSVGYKRIYRKGGERAAPMNDKNGEIKNGKMHLRSRRKKKKTEVYGGHQRVDGSLKNLPLNTKFSEPNYVRQRYFRVRERDQDNQFSIKINNQTMESKNETSFFQKVKKKKSKKSRNFRMRGPVSGNDALFSGPGRRFDGYKTSTANKLDQMVRNQKAGFEENFRKQGKQPSFFTAKNDKMKAEKSSLNDLSYSKSQEKSKEAEQKKFEERSKEPKEGKREREMKTKKKIIGQEKDQKNQFKLSPNAHVHKRRRSSFQEIKEYVISQQQTAQVSEFIGKKCNKSPKSLNASSRGENQIMVVGALSNLSQAEETPKKSVNKFKPPLLDLKSISRNTQILGTQEHKDPLESEKLDVSQVESEVTEISENTLKSKRSKKSEIREKPENAVVIEENMERAALGNHKNGKIVNMMDLKFKQNLLDINVAQHDVNSFVEHRRRSVMVTRQPAASMSRSRRKSIQKNLVGGNTKTAMTYNKFHRYIQESKNMIEKSSGVGGRRQSLLDMHLLTQKVNLISWN